jgi:hypothetical protein
MPQESAPVQLPDGYYLDNFNTLIEFVTEHYWPLLSDEEQDFYHRYHALDTQAKRLYVRLLSRSKSLFRQRKLKYVEIDDMTNAVEQLETQQLVAVDPQLAIDDLLPLFTRADLLHAIKSGNRSARRPQLEEAIKTLPQALADLRRDEPIVAVLEQASFTVYRLLFFGNLYQDLTAFVLRDLGLHRYEPYRIDTQTLPFASREQLDRHLHYYACHELFDEASAAGPDALIALHAQIPHADANDHELLRRTEKLAIAIARQLERESANDEALEIYLRVKRAPARERATRLLAKKGDNATALTYCEQMISSPSCSEELQFATQFGRRLAKKLTQRWNGPPPAQEPQNSTITLPATQQPVEIAAAAHFQHTGQCFYVENTLITGVLGLCIWDIIFAPIKGAFYHPFHNAPADFTDPGFRTTRQALLTRRFAELNKDKLASYVTDNWHAKKGIANPLVNWRYLNAELLELALERIGLSDWLSCFDYLLADLRNHRNGLPDLIYFPDDGGYQLIEIKGPGDRLQNNQRRWMAHFHTQGIDHCVVNVQWAPDTVTHA